MKNYVPPVNETLKQKEKREEREEIYKSEHAFDGIADGHRFIKSGVTAIYDEKSKGCGRSFEKNQTNDFQKPKKHFNQKVVVKMHFVKNKNKHLDFIKNYLTQLKKTDVLEKPELFADKKVDETFLKKYRENVADTNFRFIISPENPNVDFETLAKVFIEKANALLNFDLDWIASVHRNTNHPHLHIAINGKDKNGKTVYFPKNFVQFTARHYTEDFLTYMLGYRTSEEIKNEKAKLPEAERFTKIDEEIESIAKKIEFDSPIFESAVRPRSLEMKKRLEKLEKLKLAFKKDSCFFLEKNWTSKLRIIGRYNIFKKARESLKTVSVQNLELYESGEITGKVTNLFYKDDEENWQNGFLVENEAENKAWLVISPFEPNALYFNKEVSIENTTNEKGQKRLFAKILKTENEIKKEGEIYGKEKNNGQNAKSKNTDSFSLLR